MRFWAFQCSFVVNNNLLMNEVFVGATRKEVVAAMTAFFRVPRAAILVADVLGAWLVDDGVPTGFRAAKPFVRVAIAKQEMTFDDAGDALVGDLDGAVSRTYLARGKANASDAKESDEDDDEDPELKPFKLLFDAAGFLASLPAVDGEQLAPGTRLTLVRPLGVEGYSGSDDAYFHPNVELSPGWSDAEGEVARPFDAKSRFRRDLAVPCV